MRTLYLVPNFVPWLPFPGHHKISLGSSQQTIEFGNVDFLSDIFGFSFQTSLLGLWGFMLFILGDFLERQKWLKMISMPCIGIYDIQSPYDQAVFQWDLRKRIRNIWISSSLTTSTFLKAGSQHLSFSGYKMFETEWDMANQSERGFLIPDGSLVSYIILVSDYAFVNFCPVSFSLASRFSFLTLSPY